jgi:hypothetical protein
VRASVAAGVAAWLSPAPSSTLIAMTGMNNTGRVVAASGASPQLTAAPYAAGYFVKIVDTQRADNWASSQTFTNQGALLPVFAD